MIPTNLGRYRLGFNEEILLISAKATYDDCFQRTCRVAY